MGNNTTSSSGDPDHHFAPPSAPSNTDYHHARWPRFDEAQHVQNPKSKIQNIEVLVVGVCSSGKSTLVNKLREAGYNARACSQEHSYVPHLWQLSKPRSGATLLVYLDASLHTIRRRRRAKWQQTMLDEEHRRLAHAREHYDLYIPTDGLMPEDVASRVICFLRMRTKTKDEG
jgi:hypothetical protein